jgi:carboxypeptidase Taq
MQKNVAYQELTRTFQRLSRFSHLSSIASWDMFTMMPPGGSAARGEALAEMSVLQHQILTDKKVGDWLAAAQSEDLNDVEQANLREMTRHYQQASLLPESLWKRSLWRAANVSTPGVRSVRQMTGRVFLQT